MEKGIVFQGYVPVRSEPSDTSEMISQVLFGEEFRILDSDGKWLYISLDFDGYEGWVEGIGIYPIEPGNQPENMVSDGYRMVSHPYLTAQDLQLGHQVILPAGSIWPNSNGNKITLEDHEFEIMSEEGLVTPGPLADLEEIGRMLVSIPYIRGGKSGFGFDSPGLIQMLGRMMGISLPRQCNQQSELGTAINFIHEVRKGDLAYFDNKEGEINHVGMILNNGQILHSFGQVRIDKLDQQGIYNIEYEAYTHNLRIIKRVKS